MPYGVFPNLNIAFSSGIRRVITAQRGGLHSSIELQLGWSKLLSGNTGLCLSSPFSTTVLSSRPDCYFVNQKRGLAVGVPVSRSLSLHSMPSPSSQLFEYQINSLISDIGRFSKSNLYLKKSMAASGSKAVSGDIYIDEITATWNLSNFAKPTGVFFNDRSLSSCRKASMSLRNQEPPNRSLVCGYLIFDVTRRNCISNPLDGPWFKNFHTWSSSCYSAGAAPDVSFGGSSSDEQLSKSAASSDQAILGHRTLKLISGSCYLPHPDKEETGGEDAHFICIDEQAIGVADGVGGWADVGVDAGEYARELMSNSVTAIQEEPKGSIDPSRVLEKAHSSTKAKGSSTACIVALTDQQGLQAINLGDSGFIVVRDGCTIFQSPVQQHGFNFTYQLESGRAGDLPSSGQNLPNNAAVGIDPWCISVDTAQRWERAFTKKRQKLVQTSTNLVDEVWKNRPPAETNPVIIQPVEFAGRSVADKLEDLRERLMQEKAQGIIITALDEVAWLYNVRGTDVSYCPVVHAFAIVTSKSAFFYVDKKKVSSEVNSHMEENGIEVREYGEVSSDVALLVSNQLRPSPVTDITENDINEEEEKTCGFIWVDPGSCCYALYSKLDSDKVVLQQSPLAIAKAIKNPVELDGLRKAHIRDGAAVVQYLVWLDKQMQENYGAAGYFLEVESKNKKQQSSETMKLTEVSASDKLESFRASKEHFRGLSFPTISSVGPNAAIIHYSPDAETCSELDPDSIYLFDSGAQYQDGTTDITRTVHFGKPSSHEKACYTAVLKGHIGLGNARFPSGTAGHTLDILARVPLWKDGLDYRHGTGHGIGSYLNVHEGPHLISFRTPARHVPLQASMTVTDEPGYYEDGNFGIRLENVLVIKEADTKFNFGDKGYLAFEHITWAPYQKKLIDQSLLTPEEIEWVNSYHSTCRDILAPYLDESEMAWLKRSTEPLSV